MSPMLLLLQNILTFGIKSIFWMYHHLPSLLQMVKPEERLKRSTLYLWLVPYLFTLFSIVWMAWEFLLSIGDVSSITNSYFPLLASCSLMISILVYRHMLFWLRRVVMDEILQHRSESIRVQAHTFAPSSLLLWFVGIPYIQLHINRMIKKKVLFCNYMPGSEEEK